MKEYLTQGNNTHWDETNNAVLDEMLERIYALNSQIQFIFTQFIVSNSLLIKKLLGPDESNKEKVFEIDHEQISKEQFKKIHIILFESAIISYLKINNMFHDVLIDSTSKVLNKDVKKSDIYQFIKNLDEFDLNTVGNKVLDSILEVLKNDPAKVGFRYLFVSYYGVHNNYSFQQINEKMQQNMS